jgi:hypothetical protein
VRNSGIYKSTNGTDWTLVFSGDYTSIIVGNGVMALMYGGSGGTNYVTTDGVSFTAIVTAEVKFDLSSITKIGSTLVAGLKGSFAVGNLQYSSDGGSTWTAITSVGGVTTINRAFLVVYWPSQNAIYAIGDSTNRKFSTTDGINWTALGTGTGTAAGLTGNQGFGNALEIKTSTGTPALALVNRNAATLITTDGINYTDSGLPYGWLGTVNDWFIAAPRSSSSTGPISWSATGQTWPNYYPPSVLTSTYYSGFNGRLYGFKFSVSSTSTPMRWGYFDFSTVAPS